MKRERKELFCGTLGECSSWRGDQDRGESMVIEKNDKGPEYSVYWERKERRKDIARPIVRETVGKVRVQGVTKDHNRPLVVGFAPGDVMTFRPKGTQQIVTVPILSLYGFARMLHARAVANAKRAAKKGARK